MLSLRAEVLARSGRRDLINEASSTLSSTTSSEVDWEANASREPTLELVVGCEGLPTDGDGRKPNPIVDVSVLEEVEASVNDDDDVDDDVSATKNWRSIGRTETKLSTTEACFYVTIPFYENHSIFTRVKLTVYDNRELVNRVVTRIGAAEFTLGALVRAAGETLRLTLRSRVRLPLPRSSCTGSGGGVVGNYRKPRRHRDEEGYVNGCVCAKAWRKTAIERLWGLDEIDVKGFQGISSEEESEEDDEELFADDAEGQRGVEEKDTIKLEGGGVGGGGGALPANAVENPARSSRRLLEMLTGYYRKIAVRTFRLPGDDELTQLGVKEMLGEPKLLVDVPQQLVKLWVKEESEKVQELKKLGPLPGGWESVRLDLIDSRQQLIDDYDRASEELEKLVHMTMKPTSCDRFEEYELLPTNLHLQCLWVENADEARFEPKAYDTHTSAVFAAVSQGFHRGGLRRQLEGLCVEVDGPFGRLSTYEILRKVDSNSTSTIRQTLNRMETLKTEVDHVSSLVCQAALNGRPNQLYGLRTTLADKTRQLIQLCENKFLENAIHSLNQAKIQQQHGQRRRLSVQGEGGGGGRERGSGFRRASAPFVVANPNHYDFHHSKMQDSTQITSIPTNPTNHSREFHSLDVGTDPVLAAPALFVLDEDVMTSLGSWQQQTTTTTTATTTTTTTTATTTTSSGSWRWSGNRFVNSEEEEDEEEPWEITRVNVEASLVCVCARIEDLVRNYAMTKPEGDATREGGFGGGGNSMTDWLAQLSPMLMKLRACVETLVERSVKGLAFAGVMEHGHSFVCRRSLQTRRDACFSQALTSVVTAVCNKCRLSITNDTFFKQIHHIGMLLSFESLLSCYGEEVAMLEDFVVAINDLKNVAFKLEESEDVFDLQPIIQGTRQHMTVSIPLPPSIFLLLPRELQRGKLIKCVPILFNIGIDKKAAIAEKYSMITRYIKQPEFGDTWLQDKINKESLDLLIDYYETFAAVTGLTEDGSSWSHSSLSSSQLLHRLRRNVTSTRGKNNVDILNIASQLALQLNAVKFTACKNGRDNSAMSVTLQQCHLLQLYHRLDSRASSDVLGVLRSDGVRIFNVQKNNGVKRFGYDAAQIPSLPKQYRPPPGTYAAL